MRWNYGLAMSDVHKRATPRLDAPGVPKPCFVQQHRIRCSTRRASNYLAKAAARISPASTPMEQVGSERPAAFRLTMLVAALTAYLVVRADRPAPRAAVAATYIAAAWRVVAACIPPDGSEAGLRRCIGTGRR